MAPSDLGEENKDVSVSNSVNMRVEAEEEKESVLAEDFDSNGYD